MKRGLFYAWVTLAVSACSRPSSDALKPAGELRSETRALWITRFDWSNPVELRALIDSAAAAHFNLIFFQIPTNAGGLYNLRLQRWGTHFPEPLGNDGGWDPLLEAARSARERGLQLHVWLNTFYGPPDDARLQSEDAFGALLPDPFWWLRNAGLPEPQNSWQSPADPVVRTRVAALAAHLARDYPIQGVHLDFIRYGAREPVDSTTVLQWQEVRRHNDTLTLAEFRRRSVSAAVRAVRDSLRFARADVVLSAAVWGIYRNSNNWTAVSTGYDDLFQDAHAWANEGLIDFLVPMIYWPIAGSYGARTDFAYLADEHVRTNTSRFTIVGITLEHMVSADSFNKAELLAEIEQARRAQAQGISILSAARLRQQRLWSVLAEGPFRQSARLPAMPWRELARAGETRAQ